MAMSEWQPIETAPRDGTEFLAFWTGFSGEVEFYEVAIWLEDGFACAWDHEYIEPTHWMPLPEPPK